MGARVEAKSIQYVAPGRWPWALAAYAAGGVIVALAPQAISAAAARWGGPRQLGIVLAVNVLFPVVVIAASLYYPRVRMALLGAVVTLAAFTLTGGLMRDWHFWMWPISFLTSNVLHPSMMVGAVVSALLGAGAARLIRPWRRVGLPDEHLRCSACGYLLTGTHGSKCPECGMSDVPPG